jgi:ActR/RegA family two-component response regulator
VEGLPAGADSPIFRACGGDRRVAQMVYYARCAYVVEATKDGRTEYWAVAAHRDDALTIARTQTSPDWNLVLAERRLTHKQAAELKIMHNTIKKLIASEIGCCAPF